MSNSVKTVNSVLLPLIRQVMPNIIATDIIGVSPMTGPVHQILTLKGRYNWESRQLIRSRVNPEIYRVFLRINNRRTTQSDRDFEQAGYWRVSGALANVIFWCNQQFGKHGFWYNANTGTVWLANESDYRLYQMVWG